MKFSIVIICLLVSFCAAGVDILKTETPIKIDGELSEAVWGDSRPYKLGKRSKKKILNPTTVQLAYDSENLYVAFVCYEKNMKDISNKWTHDEERDNNIWTDDCVEIFLDPWGNRQRFYHIVVNFSGVIYDAFGKDVFWDAGIDVGISKHKDRWIVEMAIPFKDLQYSPKGGEVWLGNFCREEKPARENTSFFPAPKGFNDPDSLGKIKFDSVQADLDFALKQIGKKRISADIRNNTGLEQKLQLEVLSGENGAKILKKEVLLKAGELKAVTFPYKILPGTKTIDVKVVLLGDAKKIYSNRIAILGEKRKDGPGRVWKIEKPLYKELLSDEPVGLARNGTMFWQHGLNYGKMRQFALQYGQRYVYEEFFKLMADNKLLPITGSYMLTTPAYDIVSWYRKYDIKGILFADRRKGSEFKIGRYPFFADPSVGELFAKSTDEYLEKYSDVIWAVSAGDEIYEHDEKIGIKLLADKKEKYPFIGKADEEVKAKYGDGVYGIPESVKDKNPYRWIAYRRWMNDRYADTFKKFYKNVRSKKPDIKVFSMDPIAFHHPYDFSRAKEYCDIITHQLYPRRDGNFAKFGFLTKLLVDLSGVEVWPCAHVEEYAASFTPEEVVELISQIFRNGGSGLHYFLADTVGRRAKKKHMCMEYFGAPDRWQVEMALAAESRKMNKLKFPKADCAILYSCDSYGSQSSGAPGDEVEVAYTLLGPNAGSWFKFIDDNQIVRGTVKLSDYKVIYIPFAPYQRRSVVKKLVDYVRNGGTIVCGDPFAFSYDVHGKGMEVLRKQLLGPDAPKIGTKLKSAKPAESSAIAKAFEKVKAVLEKQGLPKTNIDLPDVKLVKLGKGEVYCFTANPFFKKAAGLDNYKKFFREFQKELGLKTDQKIWRFQFPMELIKLRPVPQGECLTGNYIHWQSFNPLSINNANIKGTYSYSVAPDMISDKGGVENISFTEGDLTDRRKAPTAGNVDLGKSKLADWVVRYKNLEPFSITFDLLEKYPVEKVKIFYAHKGQRPGISVEGSDDGKSWVKLASLAGEAESKDDVRDIEILLPARPVRYLRINFDKRNEGNILTLSEMEIWAKPSKVEK